jgi:hypothetical protein
MSVPTKIKARASVNTLPISSKSKMATYHGRPTPISVFLPLPSTLYVDTKVHVVVV